ncbi:uncharacterized protein LOC121866889 isoform X2 [Homarus americanus]|uniref:uncharacterized protein LOC121866889 isoform X2 n=1 Tax=Homarus americanus TaxID=6706 RepID=UPI001C4905D0|nr:uncharacterized protein LOC121866889 isoform X2 [Homarus americanus]
MTGHQLACYSCNAVFKDVLSAAEHTLECVEPPTSIKKPEYPVKKKVDPNRVKIPRPPRTWIRKYEAILLACIRDHAEIIGQAKAKVGKKPYSDVMEVLAKKLQVSIGGWVDRKAIIKKWLSLLRRARNFDMLQKGDQLLGYLHLDPPEFYGSIKEIENEIQKVKWRALHGDKQKKDNGKTLEEDRVPDVEDHDDDDDVAVKQCKVEADVEYVVDSGKQERKCIDVVDVGNTMMRKDVVLSILNQLEQGNASPTEIAQEFGIDESFLELIKQRKETIIQGIERCSLCHLLLGNKKELVTHELQCSPKNKWIEDRLDDRNENDNFQFLPATVERLVHLVIDTNPRENRRNTWKKIALHLSVLQDGVTMKRCNQKWRNLVNQCRSYEQLDKWALAHNYTHSRPVPDYYHLIIPYVNSCEKKKIRPSLDTIRKFVSTSKDSGKDDNGSWDGSNSYSVPPNEETDEGAAEFEEDDLNDSQDPLNTSVDDKIPSKSKTESESTDDMVPSLRITAKSKSQRGSNNDVAPSVKIGDKSNFISKSPSKLNVQNRQTREANTVGIHLENVDDIDTAQETIKHQAELISKFENKLDNALVLLRDISRENRRLSKAADTRQDTGMALVGDSISKMAQMQAEMQTQMMNQLETMTSMWERHHQENLALLNSLITEIGSKNVAKVVIAKPGDQTSDLRAPKVETASNSRTAKPDQTYGSKTGKSGQTCDKKTEKSDQLCDSKTGNSDQVCNSNITQLPQASDSKTAKPDQSCDSTTTKTTRTCIIMRRKQDQKCSSNTKLDQTCDSKSTKASQPCNNKTPKANEVSNSVTRKPEDEIPNKRIKRRKVIPDY